MHMFCPRCATENSLEQGYCRQCGQALSDVRLALEGSSTEALEKLRAGAKWMNGGIATLISFTLIAFFLALGGIALGDPTLTYIGMLNVFLGALIGYPILFIGKTSVKRASRLLSKSQSQIGSGAHAQLQEPGALLTRGFDQNTPRVTDPGSVTEHTTFDLREREDITRNRTGS
jgi:hypothetical protein